MCLGAGLATSEWSSAFQEGHGLSPHYTPPPIKLHQVWLATGEVAERNIPDWSSGANREEEFSQGLELKGGGEGFLR